MLLRISAALLAPAASRTVVATSTNRFIGKLENVIIVTLRGFYPPLVPLAPVPFAFGPAGGGSEVGVATATLSRHFWLALDQFAAGE